MSKIHNCSQESRMGDGCLRCIGSDLDICCADALCPMHTREWAFELVATAKR